MPAVNVVRFRVKSGRENEFVEAHRNMKDSVPGMRRGWLVKTGDRSYCVVGVWKDHADLVAARPAMIANLDKVRGCLEDLGGGLGVTDPVSGDVALDLAGKEAKSGRRKAGKSKRVGGAAASAGADPQKSARKAQRAERRKAGPGADRGTQKAQRTEQRRAAKGQAGGAGGDKTARKAKRAEQKRVQGKA
jgi:hypothetical protein